ncbi:hypothetical protein KR026_008146 [Drosophila bipectinata]|nr:hypothetical protein KR026_008146 [Drosophila bipectinata]
MTYLVTLDDKRNATKLLSNISASFDRWHLSRRATIQIVSHNANGSSEQAMQLAVPTLSYAEEHQPRKLRWENTTLVWDEPEDTNHLIGYMVYWCFPSLNKDQICNDSYPIEWRSVDGNSYEFQSKELKKVAVSANYSNNSTGGMVWLGDPDDSILQSGPTIVAIVVLIIVAVSIVPATAAYREIQKQMDIKVVLPEYLQNIYNVEKQKEELNSASDSEDKKRILDLPDLVPGKSLKDLPLKSLPKPQNDISKLQKRLRNATLIVTNDAYVSQDAESMDFLPESSQGFVSPPSVLVTNYDYKSQDMLLPNNGYLTPPSVGSISTNDTYVSRDTFNSSPDSSIGRDPPPPSKSSILDSNIGYVLPPPPSRSLLDSNIGYVLPPPQSSLLDSNIGYVLPPPPSRSLFNSNIGYVLPPPPSRSLLDSNIGYVLPSPQSSLLDSNIGYVLPPPPSRSLLDSNIGYVLPPPASRSLLDSSYALPPPPGLSLPPQLPLWNSSPDSNIGYGLPPPPALSQAPRWRLLNSPLESTNGYVLPPLPSLSQAPQLPLWKFTLDSNTGYVLPPSSHHPPNNSYSSMDTILRGPRTLTNTLPEPSYVLAPPLAPERAPSLPPPLTSQYLEMKTVQNQDPPRNDIGYCPYDP